MKYCLNCGFPNQVANLVCDSCNAAFKKSVLTVSQQTSKARTETQPIPTKRYTSVPKSAEDFIDGDFDYDELSLEMPELTEDEIEAIVGPPIHDGITLGSLVEERVKKNSSDQKTKKTTKPRKTRTRSPRKKN